MESQFNEDAVFPSEIFAALNLGEFIAIDIETTGLNYTQHEIIEIAAVRFVNGKIAETFSQLIKPKTSIPEFITQLTGISDYDVANAPLFREVLPDLRQFIGTAPLVAHHVPFDLYFLEYHARHVNKNFHGWHPKQTQFHYFPNPKYDTAVLARIYLHFLHSFSLSALADYFQLDNSIAHRALPDATNAGLIFLELVKMAAVSKFTDVQKILKVLGLSETPITEFFQNLAKFISEGHHHVPSIINRAVFDLKANHYNIIGKQTPLQSSPDLFTNDESNIDEETWKKPESLLDDSEIADFFAPGGELSRKFGVYESRQQQVAMAMAIARAFNNAEFLTVEAGTGTGKSLAYLVPAILWAMQNDRENGRVVISTNTKNLQEQLFFKDLPVLSGILDNSFKAVLLKGRANYLCLDKWNSVMRDPDSRLNDDERLRVLPLLLWKDETETGDIAENQAFRVEKNFTLWSKFIAESQYCPGQKCKYYNDCFLMKARENAKDAHLVLVNHSLLFADLAAENSVISPYRNLIFDEAHNLEKTATHYLGITVNMWSFKDLVSKLYIKEKKESGALVQLYKSVKNSKLSSEKIETTQKIVDETIESTLTFWQFAEDFFKQLNQHLRLITPENQSKYTSKIRYHSEDALFEPILPVYDQLHRYSDNLKQRLSELILYLREFNDETFDQQDQILRELKTQYSNLDSLQENIDILIAANDNNLVYWYEIPQQDERSDIRLYAVPLNISQLLNEHLFSKLRTAIFTSATLAVNRRFDYFLQRTGIDQVQPERISTLLLDSAFAYEEQALLGVTSFTAAHIKNQYYADLKTTLIELAKRYRKGTLVLFTNYSALNEVYFDLTDQFKQLQIPLLAQGQNGSRLALLARFKREKPAFLLGADSFWEGVDLPGDALQLVVITKLPFDVPTDPVFQAKCEQIQARGGNPFYELSIPEAVIRLRQGFGRLIRNHTDRGAVLILDNRISTKSYGQVFINSLPVKAKIFANNKEMWETLDAWFL
jgi:predicted DnaQ family exonuclease/DinG family helicase